ncbi:GNAT family N-acetyltransferase, partial [Acinetobacter rathckeae]|uniref:GNAT family N-acetyltransferase n=1 Tax=Acinetobacter rathckeae TaxID=2605272 RepID=UPI0018A28423
MIYIRKNNLGSKFELPLVKYLYSHKLAYLNHQDNHFVIATHLDHIVGVGVIYTNDFHPSNHYFYIHVSTMFQRQGIASKLLKYVECMQCVDRLQCLINAKNIVANDFLLKHQFYLVRKTFDIEVIEVSSESMMYETKKLNELNVDEFNQFKTIFYSNYFKYHESVNPLNLKFDQNTFFESVKETLDLDQSIVLIGSQFDTAYLGADGVLAYMLFGDSDHKSVELAYLGGQSESEIDYYCGFFSYVMGMFLKQYSKLYFESDSTD